VAAWVDFAEHVLRCASFSGPTSCFFSLSGFTFAAKAAIASRTLAWLDADLAKVQRRRELPTRVIQGFQVLAQDNAIAPT
jgi:hypothetical protein